MRTVCVALLIALFAVTSAAVAESTAPAPAEEAQVAVATAAAAPVELTAEQKAELEAALAQIDATQIQAQVEEALAAAHVEGIDGAALAAQIETACSAIDAEGLAKLQAELSAAGSPADIYSLHMAPLGTAMAGQCMLAAPLAANLDELRKALAELEESGDLTPEGAKRLRGLLATPHAGSVRLFSPSQAGSTEGIAKVYRFEGQAQDGEGPKFHNFYHGEGVGVAAPFEGQAMEAQGFDKMYRETTPSFEKRQGQPAEQLFELRAFADQKSTAELEERIAKLEAQLEELIAKLGEPEAGE